MWELAKSLLKFGAAENNDTAFHDDSSHLSSQSDKEHHNNMRGSRKQMANPPHPPTKGAGKIQEAGVD
jgi:hypothetical protein